MTGSIRRWTSQGLSLAPFADDFSPFTDHVQPTIAEPRPLPTQAEPVTAAPFLLDEGTQTGPIATISEDQLQKRVDELVEKRLMALVEEHGILLREDEYVVRREKGDEME